MKLTTGKKLTQMIWLKKQKEEMISQSLQTQKKMKTKLKIWPNKKKKLRRMQTKQSKKVVRKKAKIKKNQKLWMLSIIKTIQMLPSKKEKQIEKKDRG